MSGVTVQSELIISIQRSLRDLIDVQECKQGRYEGDFSDTLLLYESYIKELQDALDEEN